MTGPCPASPTGGPHAWLVCDNATLPGPHTWLCTLCDLMVEAEADPSGCAPVTFRDQAERRVAGRPAIDLPGVFLMSEPRKGPTRRRVSMPDIEQLPRVGKIRLGEQVEGTGKTGEAITRPSKLDYFRVEAEESGVTSAEAASSFHEVYGDEPRSIRCALPGATPDAVFEGAWRLYGANKLKRICDGTTCDERTPTGAWVVQPCICAERNIPDKRKDHCKLTWTFNVLLPDVRGVGVWQIDTGSEISIRRISSWLQMMHRLVGDLTLTEFTLDLIEAMVAPEGKAMAVYVLQPRSDGHSPRELLSGGGRAERKLIEAAPAPPVPPPVVDEGPPGDEAPGPGNAGGPEAEAAGGNGPAAPASDVLKDRIELLRGYGLSDEQIKEAGKAEGVEEWAELLDDVVWERVKARAWGMVEPAEATA